MNNEELVLLYQQGNHEALKTLIENNTGMIRKIASKYKNCNKLFDEEDLNQSGVIGLINAANKYDFELENRSNFITYAFYYIDREIQVSINGKTSKDINNTKFYKSVKSLNVPIGEDEGSDIELIDTVDSRSKDMENIEDKLYYKQLRDELEKAMKEYNTLLERSILKLEYGWNIKPMTIEDTGEILNLNKEKSVLVKYRALRKLRNSKWGRIQGRKYIKELVGEDYTTYSAIERKIDLEIELGGVI